MPKAPVRVAVTGAAGQIGYSLLFRIASGEMLGKDQPVILQMLEIPDEKAQKALKGVMMELDDCAFPLLAGMVPASEPMVAFKDAQVALLVGARPRGPGMERKDLLEANGKNIWPMINDQAWLETTFIPTVQKRGAAIIDARGLSSAASAANAAIDHVRDWVHGSKDGDWVTMGIPSDGSYGIPEGVIYGYPVTTRNGSYQIVKGIEISEFSRKRIDATLKELHEERDGVKHLLGK